MFDRVLVLFDGSNVSALAAKATVAPCRRFDAGLQAIHVVDTTEMPFSAVALVLNDTVSRAEDLVAQAETTDEAASVSVTTRAASCRPHPGAGPSSSTAA